MLAARALNAVAGMRRETTLAAARMPSSASKEPLLTQPVATTFMW